MASLRFVSPGAALTLSLFFSHQKPVMSGLGLGLVALALTTS